MTAVIVDYTFKCVLTFYILQAKPPPQTSPTRGNLPPYSFCRRAWVR